MFVLKSAFQREMQRYGKASVLKDVHVSVLLLKI